MVHVCIAADDLPVLGGLIDDIELQALALLLATLDQVAERTAAELGVALGDLASGGEGVVEVGVDVVLVRIRLGTTLTLDVEVGERAAEHTVGRLELDAELQAFARLRGELTATAVLAGVGEQRGRVQAEHRDGVRGLENPADHRRGLGLLGLAGGGRLAVGPLQQLHVRAVEADVRVQAVVEGRHLPVHEIVVVGVVLVGVTVAIGDGMNVRRRRIAGRRGDAVLHREEQVDRVGGPGLGGGAGDEFLGPGVGAEGEGVLRSGHLDLVDSGETVVVHLVAPIAIGVAHLDDFLAGAGGPAAAGFPAVAALGVAVGVPAVAVDLLTGGILHVGLQVEVADRLGDLAAIHLGIERAHVQAVRPVPVPRDLGMDDLEGDAGMVGVREAAGFAAAEVAQPVRLLAIAFLREELDRGLRQGLPGEVGGRILDLAAGVRALVLGLRVGQVDADAKLAAIQLAGDVGIEGTAILALAIVHDRRAGEVLAVVHALGDVLHHAAGIGQAVERRDRALDDLDAGDALQVNGVVFADAVAQTPVLLEAAEEKRVVGLLDDVVGIAVRATVDQRAVVGLEVDLVDDAEVIKEILGEHLDVHGEILDGRVGARAGDRVGGPVAVVALGGDVEGRELHGFFTGGGGRGGSSLGVGATAGRTQCDTQDRGG